MVRPTGNLKAGPLAGPGSRRFGAASLAVGLLVSGAAAFSPDASGDAPEARGDSLSRHYFEAPGSGGDWTVQFEPSLWYAVPGGKVDMPGLETARGEIDLIDLGVDNTGLRPSGEFIFRRGRWMGLVGGIYLEEENDTALNQTISINGTAYDAGDRFEGRLRFASGRLLGGYRIHSFQGGPTADGGYNFTSDVDIIAGARFTHINWRLAAEDPGVSRDSIRESRLFPEAIGGFRWTLGFIEQITIDTELTIGGMTTGDDDTAFSIDIIQGLAWDPHPNLGAQFGYRQLLIRHNDGKGDDRFRYDGAIAGLYAGVKVRF
ncbi:MAG: hypothetical protein JJU33_02835 [Phycisphaerales bacterium]|nr:hypothetical protein [Phycisphaerales bacterium]